MSVVQLLLLSAALASELTTSSATHGNSLNFIVVFPENIAYYHPIEPQNQISLTSLFDDANVKIVNTSTGKTLDVQLTAGQNKKLNYDEESELNQERCFSTIQIKSDKKITVETVSSRASSTQTAMVIPNDKLGTKYFIPPPPTIQGTTDRVDRAVTERNPFRLILVNTDQENQVTLEGDTDQIISLKPYMVKQVLMPTKLIRVVKSSKPLAIIFGHSCALRKNCTCSLLYTILPPAEESTLNYYIPPVLAQFVLVSNNGRTEKKDFNPGNAVVKTAGTVVLYRPGFLLNAISDKNFAGCYVINSLPDKENSAVIVVHKDHSIGVHIGNDLKNPNWEPLQGTNYVSAKIELAPDKNIIWHASSKMAVYYLGSKEDMFFGNPAPIISTSTDFRGCVIEPETIHIGNTQMGWKESVKYCADRDLELVSIPKAEHQKQVFNTINRIKTAGQKKLWIGLRRRSWTGDWYWLNDDPVESTNWADNEPGNVDEGQCAMMNVDSENLDWRDEDCCTHAYPVCYSGPVLFTI